MKSSTKKIIYIFICSIILMFTVPLFRIKEYGCALVLFLTLLSSILLLGYNKNRESNEKNIILSITLFTIFYQIFIFIVFGITTGFLESGYKLGFNHFSKIVLPVILVIVLSEILRYQLIEKGRYNKYILIITTLYFIIPDIIINYNAYDLHTIKGWFSLMSFIVFPSFIKNIYLSYNAYYYGYKANIIYRVLIEITQYFLPLIPNLGDYLKCVLDMIYPFVLLLYVNNYTKNMVPNIKEKKQIKTETKSKNKFIYLIVSIMVFIYALFMSGMLKYYFLAVGSGSMEPNISMGDLILVEKTDEYDKLKINDVLVYKKNNVVVLHRIVKIKNEDGKYIIKTKGDNNKIVDNWEIREEEIIGITRFKIKKLGYPTLWLNKLFKGGN